MGCFACPCSSGVADVAVSLDRLALPGEVAAGWLMKKGRKVRTKRRRFFVLKVGALEYYEDEGRATLKGTIPLWPRTVVSFVAKGPDADRGKIRVKHAEAGDERDLYASSVAEAEAWVGALERLQEDCRRGGAREGYLHKRGGWSGAEYQPRWCVFDGDAVFSSYRGADDDAPTVRLDFRNGAGAVTALKRVPPGAPGACFELSGFSHPFVFACETTGGRNAWVESLRAALDRCRAASNPLAAGAAREDGGADAAARDAPAPVGAPPTVEGALERRVKHALYRDGWAGRHYALRADGRLLEFAARGDAAPLAAVELARALRVERYSKRPDPTRFALKLRDGPPLKLRARDAAAAERWIAALDAWVQRS